MVQAAPSDKMLLYEFDETKPLATSIVAVSDQLKTDLEQGKVNGWTVDQLLQYFQQYDIVLDRKDLYNMIKTPPLKNVIANIQGDKVVFRGQETPAPESESDSKKIVKSMADKAAKNLK